MATAASPRRVTVRRPTKRHHGGTPGSRLRQRSTDRKGDVQSFREPVPGSFGLRGASDADGAPLAYAQQFAVEARNSGRVGAGS
eukprot:scaffold256449_cov28-Tisochrysis_lutea.AAC.3